MFSIRDSNGTEFKVNLLKRESYPYGKFQTMEDLYTALYAIDVGIVIPAKRAHNLPLYNAGKGKMREIGKYILRRLAHGAKDLTPMQKWKIRRSIKVT